MNEKLESIKLLNTAIIKSREKRLDITYEERLKKICQSPAIDSINFAIKHLSEEMKIPKDQAAVMIVDTIKELDAIWSDYVVMEGIDRLKKLLEGKEA
jgi:hypothetical protein